MMWNDQPIMPNNPTQYSGITKLWRITVLISLRPSRNPLKSRTLRSQLLRKRFGGSGFFPCLRLSSSDLTLDLTSFLMGAACGKSSSTPVMTIEEAKAKELDMILQQDKIKSVCDCFRFRHVLSHSVSSFPIRLEVSWCRPCITKSLSSEPESLERVLL